MNNGLQTERAHMGVFSTTSYISIGDPYAKKSQSDDRMKGRQFISQYPKRGLGGAAEKACYFDRQFPSLFIGEKCAAQKLRAESSRRPRGPNS